MTEKAKYYDKRAHFWLRYWKKARHYDLYLAEESDYEGKWKTMATALPALPESAAARLSGFDRQMKVLVYGGAWCGDCVRQGPIFRQLAEACDKTELRFIDREISEELQDELRVLGALRVPIVVFLSEDFHEIGRFGDRLLHTYRRKAERETGEACDAGILPPSSADLVAEREEWLDIFERMLLMLRLAPPLRQRYED
ncbi:thioredoxin family protein [bacterium]|nr:thioredoxin family protein [bacterium]